MKVKEKSKSITKTKGDKPIVLEGNGVDSLIQLALKNKSGTEQLKELMKMKYEYEEREAKKMFDTAFCNMQAKLPIVKKTKEVRTSSGGVAYKYAPLEVIVKEIIPALNEFGFSYHWTESFEREGFKRITCHITGHGHSRLAFTDIPIMSASKMTNDAQQAGSSSTYGKRYSLCGVLGIMVDEDDDGRGIQNSQTEKPTLDSICDLGKKHKGKKYREIPISDLEWIRDNLASNPEWINELLQQMQNVKKDVAKHTAELYEKCKAKEITPQMLRKIVKGKYPPNVIETELSIDETKELIVYISEMPLTEIPFLQK